MADHIDSPGLARFRASMVMDFDMWHDGTGYDLDALRSLTAADRASAESILLDRATADWRDVEALAVLATPAAHDALRSAMTSADLSIRDAVTRFAPELVEGDLLTASLVAGLDSGVAFGGLTQTLDQVESHHPPAVIEALLRGAAHREGDVAIHFAGMLLYVHGRTDSSFDWDRRPFLLRFTTDDPAERSTVFSELCAEIGVDPERFLV